MTDDLDAIAPVPPEAPKPRRKRRAAAAPGAPAVVPGDMPVRPLGQHAGVFHFLTARGEVSALSAAQLERRSSLVALFTGDPDPLAWLRLIGPPATPRDDGFSPSAAADWLMARCGELPLFDPATPVRGYGTWRGPHGPVAHVGEALHHAGGRVEPAGTIAGGAIWPATHGRAAPAERAADYEDVRDLLDALARCWAWGRDTDPETLVGFVGQALLGEYPHWRTHLYVTGRRGSGKSALLRVLSAMAGGMSAGVKKGSTAAAVRQNSNGQALLRIFDEAEAGSDRGAVEELVALLRLQSDVGGAEVERGTADHSGIRFRLFGAGALGSIIPANMPPQDRSRFVFVTLRQRDACD
ncbi:MAG: ATP-binding protein, partial [Rhodobacteraceae bacterium]|nr:ATP-binding protein [Paracoccaceae bacterium]